MKDLGHQQKSVHIQYSAGQEVKVLLTFNPQAAKTTAQI